MIEYDIDETGFGVSQDIHINKLKLFSTTSINHDAFSSIRGQLLYIALMTCYNVIYRVSQLCPVKYKSANQNYIKILSETVQHFKDTMDIKLNYPKMDKDSLKLYCFVDSGHNTNEDNTSQIGMVMGVADKYNNFHFIHWSSSKCQRSTRSMLVSEPHAFSNGFD